MYNSQHTATFEFSLPITLLLSHFEFSSLQEQKEASVLGGKIQIAIS